jgi:hypothetical protein
VPHSNENCGITNCCPEPYAGGLTGVIVVAAWMLLQYQAYGIALESRPKEAQPWMKSLSE